MQCFIKVLNFLVSFCFGKKYQQELTKTFPDSTIKTYRQWNQVLQKVQASRIFAIQCNDTTNVVVFGLGFQSECVTKTKRRSKSRSKPKWKSRSVMYVVFCETSKQATSVPKQLHCSNWGQDQGRNLKGLMRDLNPSPPKPSHLKNWIKNFVFQLDQKVWGEAKRANWVICSVKMLPKSKFQQLILLNISTNEQNVI